MLSHALFVSFASLDRLVRHVIRMFGDGVRSNRLNANIESVMPFMAVIPSTSR